MSTLYQDIQAIRALRKSIRKPTLSAAVLASVEMIHRIAKIGTTTSASSASNASSASAASSASDTSSGWKKVEWRNNPSSAATASSSSSTPYKSHNRFHNNNNNHNNNVNYNNNHRPRKEAPVPVSIPLTNSADTAGAEEDAFEPVRSSHGNRRQQNSNNNNNNNHGRNHHHHHHNHHHPSFNGGIPMKYVSRFRKPTDKVEDAIMTKIMGKLNKFSTSNYGEIKEFIMHIIDSGQTEMIKCFMKLVFQKAASEEMFCPLYARLMSELSSCYPVLLDDMSNLYSEYMEIFDDVSDVTEDETYQELCQRNVEKKYRRGYSQFLAELIKHQVIDVDVFIKTVTKIVQQVENQLHKKNAVKLVEELADCLMKMMKAIQTQHNVVEEEDNEDENTYAKKLPMIRRLMKDQMMQRIFPLTQRDPAQDGLSNKARFTFMNCYEGILAFTSS